MNNNTTNSRAMDTAEDRAKAVMGCFIDEHGNRPCDNGAICDWCFTSEYKQTVQDEYAELIR